MQQYLIYMNLWKYTTEREVIFPSRVTQADINRVITANAAAQLAIGAHAISTRVLEVQAIADYEDKLER